MLTLFLVFDGLHSSVMPCTNQANFVPSKTIKSYMKTHELRNENLFTWKAKITKKANTYATKSYLI